MNYKRLPKALLAIVKIPQVELTKIPRSFTPQCPIKGGKEEVKDTIQTLLTEGFIEPTQSFSYNSPIWPIKKQNVKWRFTVDYRNVNKLSEQMPGQVQDVEYIL